MPRSALTRPSEMLPPSPFEWRYRRRREMVSQCLMRGGAFAEDEEGGREDAQEDGAEGWQAGGDDVVRGFVDGPDGPG